LKSETTYGTVWRTRYRGSCRPVLDRLREDDDDDDDNNNNDIYVYIFNSYYWCLLYWILYLKIHAYPTWKLAKS